MKNNRSTIVKAIAIGSSISTSLAGLVLGGYFLGRYVGNRLNWHPWAEIFFVLLGLALGIAYLIYTLVRLGNELDEKRNK